MPPKKYWVLAAISVAVSACACADEWPEVRPFSRDIPVDLRSPYNLVQVDLADSNGKPVYELVCFSGDYAAEQKVGDFIYGGGLLCGLGPKGAPVEQILGNRSLLARNDSAIHSRGAFDAQVLAGPCSELKDYGRDRSFRLRGFKLQLKLSDIEVFEGYEVNSAYWKTFTNETRKDYPIGRATLHIGVSADPSAASEYAQPSPYPDPGGARAECGNLH
jgi:hypothetical protein